MLGLMKAEKIADLVPAAVDRALLQLRKLPGRGGNATLSDQSLQHAVRSLKAFTAWLRHDKRVAVDPLADVKAPRVVTRRHREALPHDQAARLIATTRTLGTSYRLTGQDRAALYALAIGSGLRVNELRSLTPEAFLLDQAPPVVVVQAAYSKNRRAVQQPITPELAELLREWLPTRESGAPVFGLLSDPAEMLRHDLIAAGLPDHIDFHCLRHSFISHLIQSGANIKVVQTLARHSTAELTLGVYTHVQIHDLAKGLEGLAHILPTPARIGTNRDGSGRVGGDHDPH